MNFPGKELKKTVSEKLTMTSGVWYPSINTLENIAPTMTYIKQIGYYIKIGKLVYVEFFVRGKITKLNGTNNYALIKGLPYTYHSNNTLGQEGLNLTTIYKLVSNPTSTNLVLYNNGIRVQNIFGTTATQLTVTSGDYFEIGGSGFYMTDE